MMDSFFEICTLLFADYVTRRNVFALVIFVCVIFIAYYLTAIPRDIPPGPSFFVPVFGNLLYLLPDGDLLRVFSDLRVKHGDVFSFYIGHKLNIVISGYDAIHDALVKNGEMFSARPNDYMNKLASDGNGILMASGDLWKRRKRFTLACLQEFGFGKTTFEDKIRTEVDCFVSTLQEHEGIAFDFNKDIQASTGNIIIDLCCDRKYRYDDAMFKRCIRGMEQFLANAVKAAITLNCLPFLRYTPLTFSFIRVFRDIYRSFFSFTGAIYDEHMDTHDQDNARDFMDKYITQIKQQSDSDFTPVQLGYILFDLLGAGTETTSSTIRWAILYLVHFPDVQERLQNDIDTVVGDREMPCLADRGRLPFVESFIMEIQRLTCVVPLFAHGVSGNKDVFFRGYRIPNDCNVNINFASVSNDPVNFENPHKFMPGRFLDSEGHLFKPKEHIPFGIGRRACLGEGVAKMELFLYLTSMLKTFKFTIPAGSPLPSLKGDIGLTHTPKPYKVCAVTRDHGVNQRAD